MIKLVYCLTRKSDLPADRLFARWHDVHGPKVRARQKALRAKKYIQSHTVAPDLNDLLQASRGLEPPYDGITEVWWESAEDLKAALASSEGARAMQELLEDESEFIDFARSRVFMTEEHTIF